MTYQTLLVRVSFWSVHGRVLKIASPLTSNHDPMSRRRSSNIGRITPSAVGPIFINKFPALTKHVCINTSQSNREGMVTARKAVISHGEYIYLHNWRWSQESRSTRESLGSQKGGRSFERPRLLCQSSWRSPICVSAEHLFYPTTKRVISIKLRFYKSFWQVLLTWIVSVLTIYEIAVFTSNATSPPIIDDHRVSNWTVIVKPSKEIERVPVFVASLPIAIRPNDVRFIGFYLLTIYTIEVNLNWFK